MLSSARDVLSGAGRHREPEIAKVPVPAADGTGQLASEPGFRPGTDRSIRSSDALRRRRPAV